MDDPNGVLAKKKEELRQEQIHTVKTLVQETLEKLEILEREKNALQGKIKILKHDLFDLKDGKLDRILERQELDIEAKNTSVFSVSKVEGQENTSSWYVNYDVTVATVELNFIAKTNNSLVKVNASGSYKLKDGTIRYL